MENFKKYTDIVDKVFNALFIAFLVVSVLMAAFAVIGFIGIDGIVIGEIDSYLTFGALELNVAENVIAGEDAVNNSLALFALLAAVEFALACVLMKILRKLISPMKEGKPFNETVYKTLRELAVLILLGGILLGVIDFCGSFVILMAYDIGALFNPETVLGHSLVFDMNGDFVIYAAVVYLLSYVFKYGTELQTQVDETL